MPGSLIDPTLQGLANALTVHQRRHELLATNLANVETPGFHARELNFKDALRDAFAAATDGTAAPSPQVVEDASAPARADGNTVDLDLEMAKLTDNSGRYNALARILGKRIGMLRQAIEGTR